MNRRDFTNGVRQTADGRWPEILPAITGVSAIYFDGKHHPCPIQHSPCASEGGGDDRFSMVDEKMGACLCRVCFSTKNGDGFSFIQKTLGCEFKEAVDRVADHLGIDPFVKRKSEVDWSDWSSDLAQHFIKSKPGITEAAILAAGGRMGRWSNQSVIAFPIIGKSLAVDRPIGYVLVNAMGGTLKVRNKDGKTVAIGGKGSGNGLVGLHGIKQLAADSVEVVWKVEGISDLLALSANIPERLAATHVVVTNACGTSQQPGWMAGFIAKVKSVYIAHDCDEPGQRGATEKWCPAVARCGTAPRNVLLFDEIEKDHGRDTRDWLNLGNDYAELLAKAEGTAAFDCRDKRPQVLVTPDEYIVNNLAAAELRHDPELFQRGGKLVSVSCGVETQDKIRRSVSQPQINEIKCPTLREKLSERCYFAKEIGEGELRQVNPPQSCVNAILDRVNWPGVSPLAGIVLSPIIRSDGSILSSRGYDPATGLYLAGMEVVVDVPGKPTQSDASQAAAALLDVVCDFPFEKPEHASAWLSAVLTPLARHAFDGPAPLHLIDANMRGSGKTLLADLVSRITHGDEIAKMTNPRDNDEARKAITAICRAGDPLVLIDNVNGYLGSPALAAALTATRWQDRVLQKSELVNLPLLTCWLASGNNIVLRDDTSRRVLHVRLQSPLEQPEARTDFRHANVREYAVANRGQLLSAALTILRAYIVAGQPQRPLSAWGSFEGWSSVVRQALVFAGQPDPAATRQEFSETNDQELLALKSLVNHWREIDTDLCGLTSGEIYEAIRDSRDGSIEERNRYEASATVREALVELCSGGQRTSIPNTRQIGNGLRRFRKRIIDGYAIDFVELRSRVRKWTVIEPRSPVSPASPELSVFGGDSGASGDTSNPHTTYEKRINAMEGNSKSVSQRTPAVSSKSSVSPNGNAGSNEWVDPERACEYGGAMA